MDPEIAKIILPAIIGAGSAIVVLVIKDIVLYEIRERRSEKRKLLDRRLSQLYAPIFIALKGGEGMLGNIFLADERIFEKFTENMHLLSPELYDIAQQYMKLGKDVKSETLLLSEQKIALELSKQFNETFLSEFERLREEYQGGLWRFRIAWRRLTRRSKIV
jgi:hypothetical protein